MVDVAAAVLVVVVVVFGLDDAVDLECLCSSSTRLSPHLHLLHRGLYSLCLHLQNWQV